MNWLSLSILIFCLMEFGNVSILYFWPNHRLGNGVAFFDSWEEAKSDEMMEMFVHYLMYWVAGVKLIFIFLLLVVLVTGSDLTKFFAVIAMILSIATYFWKLHPLISRLDQAGKITPQGYSLKLGKMIKGFLVMFSLALVFAMLSV